MLWYMTQQSNLQEAAYWLLYFLCSRFYILMNFYGIVWIGFSAPFTRRNDPLKYENKLFC